MSEAIDETRLNELIGKVIGDVAGAMSVFMAYLGDQAGVFAAMDGAGPLTLETLAEYPIITYHDGFTGRGNIDKAFHDAGLSPDVVMSAMDTDVLKTYVGLGLGVGIIASMAFDRKRDQPLRLLTADNLFPPNTTWIAVRRGSYLRRYAYRFIELCSAALSEKTIRKEAAPLSESS